MTFGIRCSVCCFIVTFVLIVYLSRVFVLPVMPHRSSGHVPSVHVKHLSPLHIACHVSVSQQLDTRKHPNLIRGLEVLCRSHYPSPTPSSQSHFHVDHQAHVRLNITNLNNQLNTLQNDRFRDNCDELSASTNLLLALSRSKFTQETEL